MGFKLGQKIIDNILRKKRVSQPKEYNYTGTEYNAVLKFFKGHQNFRTLHECSKITGLEIEKCEILKSECYKKRDLGMYYFEADADSQKYMKEYILKHTNINFDSKILEIGPGNCPVFNVSEYNNWVGIDKNYAENKINFNGKCWAESKYPQDKIYPLSWENISEISKLNENIGQFDLVVSSHSYEHVFSPIKSLIEAAKVIKDNGYIVMFVPDGFSDEPAARGEMTHTLYLVPEMIREFFDYANKYYDLSIEVFRPNYDYVIIARKKGE